MGGWTGLGIGCAQNAISTCLPPSPLASNADLSNHNHSPATMAQTVLETTTGKTVTVVGASIEMPPGMTTEKHHAATESSQAVLRIQLEPVITTALDLTIGAVERVVVLRCMSLSNTQRAVETTRGGAVLPHTTLNDLHQASTSNNLQTRSTQQAEVGTRAEGRGIRTEERAVGMGTEAARMDREQQQGDTI